MTLKEILKEKAELLSDAEKDFLAEVIKAEGTIFSKILKFIRSISIKNGRFVREKVSKTRANKLASEILDVIKTSTLKNKVSLFLKDFDRLEKLNIDAYDLTNVKLNKSVREQIGVLKSLQIDSINNAILGDANLSVNYVNKIRDILTTGIAQGAKVSDIETAIKNYVKGQGNGGKLTRYSRQIARDALNQYDGQINDFVRAANDLEHFIYINPLVDDSRANCQELVKGRGKFERFVVARDSFGNPIYKVSDIAAILRAARKGKGSGFNPAVTPDTFAQYRMGWNCNHTVIFGRLEYLK